MTDYIPSKPIHFEVQAGQDRELSVEAFGGDYEPDELALAFDAVADALRRLQFAVHAQHETAEGLPALPVRFPVRRLWELRSAELALKEEPAGGAGDTFLLAPEQGRTWRLEWKHDGTSVFVLGDAHDARWEDLHSHDSAAAVSIQSLHLELAEGGQLRLSGHLSCLHAPPFNRAFEVQVASSGVAATGSVTADGRLQALLQPLPSRPPKMRYTIQLPAAIGNNRVTLDTGDIIVQTQFRGAAAAVTDTPPLKPSDTISAGHLPRAISFSSWKYQPVETTLEFVSQRDGRRYAFHMLEAGTGMYRLTAGDAGMTHLLEDRLEVHLESQPGASAGTITIVPETLRGYWFASNGRLEWNPVRELRELNVPHPNPEDQRRPQRVDYSGKSLAVDPTAFDALPLKDPASALVADEIAFLRARQKTYLCIEPDGARGSELGTMNNKARLKYALPTLAQPATRDAKPVIFQSEDGSEQGLLWNRHRLPSLADSHQRISIDAIEAAEKRGAVVVFRGIYLPVSVRKIAAAGSSEHWIIELHTPLAMPSDLQVEPFLPLMMRVDGTPPSQIALWQFGEPETPLIIRGDGIPAGSGVGYVYRLPSNDGKTPYQWMGFPPAPDETELIYCSWRGFLIRFDRAAVQFAGWFLPTGEYAYPARAPFEPYRFSRKRKTAGGRIRGSPAGQGDGWTWLETTVPEEDRSIILKRVKDWYPSVPSSEADVEHLDATQRDVTVGTRHYVVRPSWSFDEKTMVITLMEQSPAKSSDSVTLFAEKKKN